MRHTSVLTEAMNKAMKCDCIICSQNLLNLWLAEMYWEDAVNHPRYEEEQRMWARINWIRYANLLIEPEFHLPGKPLKEKMFMNWLFKSKSAPGMRAD